MNEGDFVNHISYGNGFISEIYQKSPKHIKWHRVRFYIKYPHLWWSTVFTEYELSPGKYE